MSLTRDWFAAHGRHEATIDHQLEARHEREHAAERATEQRAKAEEAQARGRDARGAWAATRELVDDDADGPVMEARVNAFFDELERRDIARWSEHREPEPPEYDDAEAEL